MTQDQIDQYDSIIEVLTNTTGKSRISITYPDCTVSINIDDGDTSFDSVITELTNVMNQKIND